MNDKKLLMMAAKAADIDLTEYNWFDTPFYTGFERRNLCEGGFDLPVSTWNPLTEDGDALRLAVNLKMTISHLSLSVLAQAYYDNMPSEIYSVPVDNNRHAATRRAIVRAAAAIGAEL